MAAMVDLTFSLLPGSEALAQETRDVLEEHLGAIRDKRSVSLRDVHGDNLIWRPDRTGPLRIGLLDFQDALVLPEGYDLASLVDDPRRTVPEAWRDDLIRAHAAARGLSEADMSRRVDLLSLQRNLRILGIFRRLATELGRPGLCPVPAAHPHPLAAQRRPPGVAPAAARWWPNCSTGRPIGRRRRRELSLPDPLPPVSGPGWRP